MSKDPELHALGTDSKTGFPVGIALATEGTAGRGGGYRLLPHAVGG